MLTLMSKSAGTKKELKTPVKRRNKGHVLAKPIPKGEHITDLKKSKWIIGSPIGQGGFGVIYSGFSESENTKKCEPPYVIKIEPHGNGPLFVEMHFYMKVGKKDDIEEWKKKHKVSHLGVPQLYGYGSHEYNSEKYRFLVIDRYGKDLWTVFTENDRRFPDATVFKIALQVLDVLQYIHEKNYIHGDIKGSNLLIGASKDSENQVYLVDYGLAERYSTKEFKPDKKRAHNGTIEYTSRDAHLGVPTRRGDLEILGFNMLQWIISYLPWEKDLKDPVKVQQQKEEFMKNVTQSLKKLKSSEAVPAALVEYLKYTTEIEHDQEPDYNHCRQLFKKGLKGCAETVKNKLVFRVGKNSAEKETPKKQSRVSKRKIATRVSEADEDEEEDEKEVPKKKKTVKEKTEVKAAENGSDTSSVKSWRDFPTVVAGRVGRAGEYKRKSADEEKPVRKGGKK
ncbi:hypothetical protein J437_LFUL014089 [Ladona fulva]|uniref:non-specific serine/threonine protein kinase n=1 Tax=Ladona fulva TaxID=123851 RepID=A0A8K0P9E0_LADFU|nr:hypothetical protein J437_LFUL014089 [Ladona fulva]